MIEVKVMDSHNFEKAMRIFKKQCQKEGFLVKLAKLASPEGVLHAVRQAEKNS